MVNQLSKGESVCRYDIDVEFDLEKSRAHGSLRVFVRNVFEKPLRDLIVCFKLPPYGKERRLSVKLDDRELPLVCMEEVDPLFEKYFLVKLPTELEPGGGVELYLEFCGKLGVASHRGLMYLGDVWYPRVVFSREFVGDYVARILVSEDCCVASSGCELRVCGAEGGMREYVVKADRAWRFGLVLGSGLRVCEGEVRGIQVKSYYISETEKWGSVLLENACDVLDFYCSEFGFYPHRCLSVVPGRKEFTGGYPVATNLVAIHDLDKLGDKALEFSKWITAHEIGHMYWGHYVLSREALDWLMIGLGIYMDRHYSEARGLSLDRYRRGGKLLFSFIERYLDGVRKGYDTTIVQPPEKIARAGFDWNNIVVHGKGYAVISMLEQLLGRETFRKIHDEALRRYAFREMSVEDFKKLCEELGDEDLEWFFYEWLYTNRFLSYKITQIKETSSSGLHRAEVKVVRFGSATTPVPVAAFLENGGKIVKWTDRRLRVNTLVFESKTPVKKVVLDPDKVYPLLDPAEVGEQLLVDQITQYFAKYYFSVVADFYEIAVEKNLEDAGAWFKLGLCLYDVKRYREAVNAFNRTLKLLEENPENPLVVWSYIWIGHLYDLLGERKRAFEMYQKAISTGNKAVFQFAQYNIGPIDALTWASERLREPFKRVDRLLI